MPDLPPRTPKTLAQWEELDYVRRRRLFRRSWRWALGLGALLPLLAVGWGFLPGKQTAFQAGPLSSAHALFSRDCRTCHTEPFRTLHRFVNPSVRTVSDETCSTCHSGPVHHATQARTPNCAACHREHRGHEQLARVDDAHCLACHKNLARDGLAEGKASLYKDVPTWAEHPPFARRWLGGPDDPGTVRFNHAKHLVPAGVPTLDSAQLALLWEGAKKEPPHAGRKLLQCADCHQPDEAGQFMRPIRYEQHCQACHPLSVQVVANLKPPHAKTAWEDFNQTPAPHVEPAAVRAALRDRLTAFIQKHERDFLGGAAEAEPTRPVPGARRPDAVNREQHEWVNQQLPAVERVLFDTGGGCRYCHQAKEPERRRGLGELPEFLPSRINARQFPRRSNLAGPGFEFSSAQWFPHSRFRHDSHRLLDCRECHPAETSSKTSDVLLPKIEDCRKCHSQDSRAAARADCVTCHAYHPAPDKRAFRGTLALPGTDGKLLPRRDRPAGGD